MILDRALGVVKARQADLISPCGRVRIPQIQLITEACSMEPALNNAPAAIHEHLASQIDLAGEGIGGESARAALAAARERAAALKGLEISYIDNPLDFAGDEVKSEFLAPLRRELAATAEAGRAGVEGVKDDYIRDIFKLDARLMSREEEHHQFRRYNYIKRLAAREQALLDAENPCEARMDRIDGYLGAADGVRNEIVEANLRLAVNQAKKIARDPRDYQATLDDANDSIMRAVEGFDYSRGNRFSTYATWAIRMNASKFYQSETRRRSRFRQNDMAVEGAYDHRGMEDVDRERALLIKEVVPELLKHVTKRQAEVLKMRFGFEGEEMTLDQAGKVLEVTKERVRQIQNQGIERILKAVEKGTLSREILGKLGSIVHLGND